jgi:hypothetical protein
MNRNLVAAELVKIAKELIAVSSLLDYVVKDEDVAKLKGVVDEQTYDLAVEVYSQIRKALELNGNQNEALIRLLDSVHYSHVYKQDTHRNNIFKAAHALGIKLPSSMF